MVIRQMYSIGVPVVWDSTSLENISRSHRLLLFGNGICKMMNFVAHESSIFITRNILRCSKTVLTSWFSPGSHSARQVLERTSQHTTFPLVVEKLQRADVIGENQSRSSPRGRVAARKFLTKDGGRAVLFTASTSCDVVNSLAQGSDIFQRKRTNSV